MVGCGLIPVSPSPEYPGLPTQGMSITASATPIDYSKLTFPETTALAETQLASFWQANGTPVPPTLELPNAQNILSRFPNSAFYIACSNGYPAIFEAETIQVNHNWLTDFCLIHAFLGMDFVSQSALT
jgi:hypothetical protein